MAEALKLSGKSPHCSRGTFHFNFRSFQGSFFLENLWKPEENSWFFERTLVGKTRIVVGPGMGQHLDIAP